MADNTTTTPTPQSNGVPLSALPALTAPVNGEELLLITKNNQSLKTTAAALKAYINAEMATLAGMQQAVKTVSDRIDALVNGDASSAIDTFNEIEAFLTGITDTETLTGLLAELKSTITAETDNKLNTKVDKVNGKGLSTNDYTNEEKAKLGALPTNAELETSLAGKQAAFTTSDELSMSAQNKLSLTDKAKMALFIDQWNAACGNDGKYDPINAPDAQHPFYLNTLWLNYAEAARVLRNIQRPPYNVFAANNDIAYLKTNLFRASTTSTFDNPIKSNCIFAEWAVAEVINLSNGSTNYVPQFEGMSIFRRCVKLREIIGLFTIIKMEPTYAPNFLQCLALVDMKLHKLAVSINLGDSPLLSLTSLQYLVTNAANTSEITITVHPNVYAKLSGDTTNAAAAALTADELAAWQAVMTAASAKSIAFATTE